MNTNDIHKHMCVTISKKHCAAHTHCIYIYMCVCFAMYYRSLNDGGDDDGGDGGGGHTTAQERSGNELLPRTFASIAQWRNERDEQF